MSRFLSYIQLYIYIRHTDCFNLHAFDRISQCSSPPPKLIVLIENRDGFNTRLVLHQGLKNSKNIGVIFPIASGYVLGNNCFHIWSAIIENVQTFSFFQDRTPLNSPPLHLILPLILVYVKHPLHGYSS